MKGWNCLFVWNFVYKVYKVRSKKFQNHWHLFFTFWQKWFTQQSWYYQSRPRTSGGPWTRWTGQWRSWTHWGQKQNQQQEEEAVWVMCCPTLRIVPTSVFHKYLPFLCLRPNFNQSILPSSAKLQLADWLFSPRPQSQLYKFNLIW